MRISKKAEYALRAALILAAAAPGRTLQIQELAESGAIPVKFLEQILLALKNGGLLRSKRGVGGGYQLDRPPRSISVGEIITIIDGSLSGLAQGIPTSGFPGAAGMHAFLEQADRRTNDLLHSQSLADVLEADRARELLAFEI